MVKSNFIKLIIIISSILVFSLIIGDTIMTPIIFYHKLLVQFFGYLFLLLIVSLIMLKFKANYQFIYSGYHETKSKKNIFKMTLLDTIKQISRKSLRFFSLTFFLVLVTLMTATAIWINNQFITFPAN
ncbi:MAG: hypothetical protein OEV66_02370 [Spirochaetia bacterium]|nr:hypothetical protein [Spirochaetia bacterium]